MDANFSKRGIIKDKSWTSGNKRIDSFIRGKQLDASVNIIFEWISYDQFKFVKEIGNGFTTATWKNGPFYYNLNEKKWKRKPNKRVTLRYLYNPQSIFDALLTKVKLYFIKNEFLNKIKSEGFSYGMTQDPETKIFIFVFHEKYFERDSEYCEKCGEEYTDKIFKWSLNEKVVLKYSQNISNEMLNEVILENSSVGLSQNPDTKEYVVVHNKNYFEKYCEKCGEEYTDEIYKWCKPCQVNFLTNHFSHRMDKSEQINDFILEEQLKINCPDDIVFEWIPYNQFNFIKEVRKGFATAVWKDGLLEYNKDSKKYERKSNVKIALLYLYDLTDEYLKKVKSEDKCYGISKNPDTKDYIMIFYEEYFKKFCEICGEKYNNSLEIKYKWCKSCQYHKNKKINDFIQEKQLKVSYNSGDSGTLFEWIPFDQFSDIKKIDKGGFSTVYSAIWKNGPLHYNINKDKWWTRESNKKVALKCICDPRVYEFLNEAKAYLAYTNQDFGKILKIYGISQNPNTKEFIMVLEYAEGGNLNDYLCQNYDTLDWLNKIIILTNIIKGLKEIHQKQMVHRDFHPRNILFRHKEYTNICISDMGLCGEVDGINETKVYGVMPYVAPEVLRRNPYTQAADIYSFGMIMYFVATGSQPFSNRDHELLALDICNGIRPEINENEQKVPKCFIDLMKRCWNSNPKNRPSAIEIEKLILVFYTSYVTEDLKFKFVTKFESNRQSEIKKQFKEAEEYRKSNHLQVICTSRSSTNVLTEHSECLSCVIY
ncbi:kinase-like domain-containing protein [Rhizophagus clarus]|uniref:Kinase-like domain-containing protein n=1 Tax=Rhizophagus clarus TaxID=94130 RepID=A0A8H3LS90_9GLOM|nr:kinase-like domain-containing protein [Rhizophagus clarus]